MLRFSLTQNVRTHVQTALAVGVIAFSGLANADPIPFIPADQAPAHGSLCSSSQLGQILYVKLSEQFDTVITDYIQLRLAPGTSTSRTLTLSQVETVNRSVSTTTGTSVSAEAGFNLFASAKVSATASLNRVVSTSESTASTVTQSVTWNFSQPGVYGFYRGTIRATYNVNSYTCIPLQGFRWMKYPETYVVSLFTVPEEGSVICADPVPSTSNPNSVSLLARWYLTGC